MDKLLVEVFVPAAGKRYEVQIPQDLRLYEIGRILAKLFEGEEPGSYREGDAALCDRGGAIYNASCTPRELGWQNGEQLLFY